MIIRLILKLKHIPTLNGYAFLFIIFFNLNANGQNVYVRVTENDCVNCYIGFFKTLLENSESDNFKYVFPGYYNEKRFANFNKMFFQNKVKLNQTIFSDSLFNLPEKKLGNESGLFVLYKGKLVYAEKARIMAKEDASVRNYIEKFNKTEVFLDKAENGISNRFVGELHYQTDQKIFVDDLFRVLYYWDKENELTVLDLKSEIFQKVLKNFLTTKSYQSHLKYKDNLIQLGKNYPEAFMVKIADETLYLNYYIPFIRLEKDVAGNNETLGVLSLPVTSIIPITKEELTLKRIVENSFVEDIMEIDYFTSLQPAVYCEKLYKLNQFTYSREDKKSDKSYPLLTSYYVDFQSERIRFDAISEELRSFEFQKDVLLNTKELFVEVGFLNQNKNILLINAPFVVDLESMKKIKLDWSEDLNDIKDPNKMTYQHLQFWENGHGNYTVLLKSKEDYYIKSYNKSWKLQQTESLNFDSTFVKDIKFSNDFIYLFTDTEILSIPSFLN